MNPVGTAWELTTLSFVIDWFISVGDFIAARHYQTHSGHISDGTQTHTAHETTGAIPGVQQRIKGDCTVCR